MGKRKTCFLFSVIFALLILVSLRTSTNVSAISAPTLLSPEDDGFVNTDSPFLEWNAVTDAVQYQVQLATLEIIWDPFFFANTTNTNYTIPYSLPLDTYYWRVRALDENDTWSPLSEIWCFKIDETKPYINRPPNVEYEVGETGNEIDWIPIDDFPGDYIVYFNDTEIQSGQWNSTEWITINVDGLPEGVYNYTIWLDDQSGVTNVDTVWVTVTPVIISEYNMILPLVVIPLIVIISVNIKKKKQMRT